MVQSCGEWSWWVSVHSLKSPFLPLIQFWSRKLCSNRQLLNMLIITYFSRFFKNQQKWYFLNPHQPTLVQPSDPFCCCLTWGCGAPSPAVTRRYWLPPNIQHTPHSPNKTRIYMTQTQPKIYQNFLVKDPKAFYVQTKFQNDRGYWCGDIASFLYGFV